MSKTNTLKSVQALLTRPGTSHTILLTSFRRSGQGVSTPVGMRSAGKQLYFMTPASSWKTKRIRNDPHVTLALCTFQGKALSPMVDGLARRLAGIEAKRARKWLCVGFAGWLVNALYTVRYPGDKTVIYEVVLRSAPQQAPTELIGGENDQRAEEKERRWENI